MTIAEKQWSSADATFGAGAMKHKEEEYHLFPDVHVHMVGFPPGFSTDNHSLFRGIVKPSFKTTGNYSTVVALSKMSAMFLVHSVIAKPELVDVVNMLLHCRITFSAMLQLC